MKNKKKKENKLLKAVRLETIYLCRMIITNLTMNNDYIK